MQNDKHRSEEKMKNDAEVVGRSVEPVVGIVLIRTVWELALSYIIGSAIVCALVGDKRQFIITVVQIIGFSSCLSILGRIYSKNSNEQGEARRK